MADEQKTANENTETPTNTGNENTSTPTDGNNVSMSQEDFNALIGKKIGKAKDTATTELLNTLGIDSLDTLKAQISKQKELEEQSKTDFEKLQENLTILQSENETLKNQIETAQKKAEISGLSAENGIKDLEVFELLYNQNSIKEGFDKNSFIDSLKESKPFLFENVAKNVTTDKTKNKDTNPENWSERVKNAKTRQELDALYKQL